MRTIKRQTLAINAAKLSALENLCLAYAREKQHGLDILQSSHFQALLGRYRTVRDEFVKQGYQSVSGLQARHWKLALQDAMETWDKYWQALFVQIRSKIFKCCFNETERRYAYFLLKGYEQFAELMQGGIPEVAFELSGESRKRVAGYVRRLVKRTKGKNPSVKKAQIVKFDANCYEVFEHEGRQYLKIMSLERGKRLVLPLKGHTSIEGTITLVLAQGKVEIHVSQELKPAIFITSSKDKGSTSCTSKAADLLSTPSPEASKSKQVVEAVDFGYTEVLTDTQGNRYGEEFGNILTKRSDKLAEKMKKRHRLHALEKKRGLSNPQKAKRMRRYNLGRQKLSQIKHKSAASLKCEINSAINKLLKTKKPSIIITENLSHLFTYDKSKNLNRRLSSWLRGEIQERVAFKALAEGFRHEQVNPAYGSQTCTQCGFVDRRNRAGDRFKCLHCRHEDIADRIAAKNYAGRYGDQEIKLYTPYSEVKTILLERFHRRLEAGLPATVPGRTLETVSGVDPPQPVETINVIAGREQSRINQTVTQRAKQNKHVLTRF